ncbi:PREDICTED: cAMP-dependent protein kinase catalytic subunit gamma-like [Nicrophorus vespilloides]|uniref:cAMP-dependent protein kinase catalytic subunit gamma-like n=1 Tax=Nicrophorus vespilloides TaxID=110193 RepID=A0ABM1NEG5_NICVS|nr:PREDICTED: cAMP-dependent protein kinase catalytic subunit gamma-like [Nicrophorus vespilloides]
MTRKVSEIRRDSEEQLYEAFLKNSKTYFEENFTSRAENIRVDIEDFDVLAKLGAGAFGKIFLVQHKLSKSYYALKVLKKKLLKRTKQIDHTLTEKRVMQTMRHPFMVGMEFHAVDNCNVYFVMPYMHGGDLFGVLNKYRKFDEDMTRFYASQVFLALEHMHYLDVVFRDLKPENILVDHDGYIKLTDFGFAKLIKGRTFTICGTPEYIAPELIMMKGYGMSCDWWSFGILIYELTAGIVPFKDKGDPLKLYSKIVDGRFPMIPSFSKELKDLMFDLLEINVSKRIGCLRNGPTDIRRHPWFRNVKWLELFNKKIKAPYKPPPPNIEALMTKAFKYAPKISIDLDYVDSGLQFNEY